MLKETLVRKIRAGYPIVYIDTLEERRIMLLLRDVANYLGFDMHYWTAKQDIDVIDFIDSYRGKEKKILVLLDMTELIKAEPVIRTLKTAVATQTKNRIFLIGTGLEIPASLRALVETVEAGLPSREELGVIVDSICKEVEDKETIVEALRGLTSDEAANVIAESVVAKKKPDKEFILTEKCVKLSSRDYLKVSTQVPDLSEIGGLDNLISWLKLRRRAFSPAAKEFGLPLPKGLLIVGLPGCGKSLTAKASAGILKVPLIRFDIGALMGSLVGESERNTREALRIAEAMSPCVLWIDELDKQVSVDSGNGGHEVTRRVLASILTWLQEKTAPVFVIATANNVMGIASTMPELLRKGRWDEIFYVGLPSKNERKRIWEIHVEKFRKNIDIDYEKLAVESASFTGAEIEACVKDAMYMAFEDEKDLNMNYLMKAIKKTRPYFADKKSVERIEKWLSDKAVHASITDSNDNSFGINRNIVNDEVF